VSTTPDSDESKRPATLGEMLFGHAILLIFCVGLPVIFTAAAPLTVTTLTREGGSITAHVSKRLLFIVPFQRITLRDVTSVGDRFVAGSTGTIRNPTGGTRSTRTEDSAFLTIESATGSAKVEVSPVNVKAVLEKAGAFVDNPSATSLRLVTVANWKFGVFAGGILSLLTVFYLYLQLSSLVRWIGRLVRG
jgi:hypothetical protein